MMGWFAGVQDGDTQGSERGMDAGEEIDPALTGAFLPKYIPR
jgi:hypothetical protein